MRNFLNGIAAGCAFVAVALLGRIADAIPTLPDLAQDRLVLLLPGSVFSLLLDRFLYLGKPLLFAGLLATQVLIGGVVGIGIGRWGRPAMTAFALWLVTGLVVLPLVGRAVFAGSVSVALLTLAAFAAYALVFLLISGGAPASLVLPRGLRLPLPIPRQAGSDGHLDRRRFLGGGLLALTAVVLARRAIGKLPALPSRGSGLALSGNGAQTSGGTAEGGAAAFAGLPPAVTSPDQFYIVSKNLLDPEPSAGSWRLHIDGLVNRSLTLRYSDLVTQPPVNEYRTLECISNEVGGALISTGLWTGVRLTDLLQRAGVQAGGAAIEFTSADGYTATMPLSQALDLSTLVAYQLDGKPLSAKHGYPARVLGAGTYGMKNPKWLTRITVVRAAPTGFWQKQGWDDQDIVQTMSQIDTPVDGARVSVGSATIAGIAFAGARGVTRVEVTTDTGVTWSDAQLLPVLGPNTWTFWQQTWQPRQPGAYTLIVRATDGTGTVQPARRTDPFPAGATGLHQVRVRVTA